MQTREFLTFSMLVAIGGGDGQLRGHAAPNLNVGNDRTLLIDVATQLLPFIGYPRTLNGLASIEEVNGSPGS
jgi:4-carboxymuconolactone decarboxylase